MKKSIPILLTAIALMSVTWGTSHAQVTMNSHRAISADEGGVYLKAKSFASTTLNGKAEKNFKKDYHLATGAEWSTLQDKSFLVRFIINNIPYRAFYTAHGQWIATISSYDASKLDKEVYDKIKSAYYNSTIVFVNQIDQVNSKTIYNVEIQDDKTIKELRVDDNEMEIVQELDKH